MGSLVISLDFELRWGVLDKVKSNINEYKENIANVHTNVPWMLKVFKERNISATWATVGAVGCDNWEEFNKVRPILEPNYENKDMNYNNNFNHKIDKNGELYFAPNLIREILNTPNQELGTHTFGHIYGTEPFISYDEFKEDLLSCKRFLSEKFGYTPESLVFPRNQVIYEKELIRDNIIKLYRGNEKVDYMSASNQREKRTLNRLKILFSSINPYISYSYKKEELYNRNIPSSAMFRIYLSGILRKIHLYKLKQNIKSLEKDDIYHIWYHPHNLRNDQNSKDSFIQFFDFIGNLIAKNKLESHNMKSIYQKYNGK